jgi:hypothetical protein
LGNSGKNGDWRELLFLFTWGGARRLVYTELAEVLIAGYYLYSFQPKEKKLLKYAAQISRLFFPYIG